MRVEDQLAKGPHSGSILGVYTVLRVFGCGGPCLGSNRLIESHRDAERRPLADGRPWRRGGPRALFEREPHGRPFGKAIGRAETGRPLESAIGGERIRRRDKKRVT